MSLYPIVLVSSSDEFTADFLSKFRKEHSFSPAYLMELRPLKTEFVIDQVRELKKEIRTIPAEKRLIVIYSFESANTEAQNAMLKMLEEQTADNQFILVTTSEERVLPTIISRSRVIRESTPTSRGVSPETIELDRLISADGYAFLAQKDVLAIDRERALVLIDELITLWRTQLKNNVPNSAVILKKTLSIRSQLISNNLNPQLAIDHILLFAKKYRS